MKKLSNPTLEDVARIAKVSTATISRSINKPGSVANTTLDRIQNVIREIGYIPNSGGRMLASNRSNTVGAVIPTMANAMFASGLQTFQEELSEIPTVIICGNDVLAAGAIVRARQLGIVIPEQVSITGFDDIGIASALPITDNCQSPTARNGANCGQTTIGSAFSRRHAVQH